MQIEELMTPCPVVDEEVMNRNIKRLQKHCTAQGLAFRPHIKTHKLLEIGRLQIQAGAEGINCQKLSEAEVFAAGGFKDILITYNLLGEERLRRLRALADSVRITVVADSRVTVDALDRAMEDAAAPLGVMVECDTGAARCGVQSPLAAAELAEYIATKPWLSFAGLLTYPPVGNEQNVLTWLETARGECEAAGVPVPCISSGGTPGMWASQGGTVTEYRAGTYVYNDMSLVTAGVCAIDDCALSVRATVVSRPTSTRAVVDAGSKALSSDLLGLVGHGLVREYPDARIYALSEEHACVDLTGCETRPDIGEQVSIVPNHVCVVSNLFDRIHFARDGVVTRTLEVNARGCVY